MKISDLIREDLIIPDLHASQGQDVLQELAGRLAERYDGVSQPDLVRVLIERERKGSTALGEGVAIPHGKLDSVGKLIACLGRARNGVDFGSADGKPTYFFFALVGPERSAGAHLKALARISRLFKDPAVRARLMDAETAQDMHRILADANGKS